jgi:hypothetical protein
MTKIVQLIGFLSLIPSFLQAMSLRECNRQHSNNNKVVHYEPHHMSRRNILASTTIGTLSFLSTLSSLPSPVLAVADCFQDCVKNCRKVAPKDPEYCLTNCKDYCEQDDRTDGLSGSVSSSTGEVGILGGTFGQGTVPTGEDKVSQVVISLFQNLQ